MKYNDKESRRMDRILTAGLVLIIGGSCLFGAVMLWHIASDVFVPEAPASGNVLQAEDVPETAGANLAVISPTLVKYTQEGATFPAWGYFFGIRNGGDEPARLTGYEVTIKDASGKVVDTPESTSFAPAVLQPGQTGYGVCAGLDLAEGSYPSEGLTIEVEPITAKYGGDEETFTITASGANVTPGIPGSPEILKRGVTVNAYEETGLEADNVRTVVGLYDASGALIGAACNLDDGTTPAGSQMGAMVCGSLVIAPDMNLDRVASMDPVFYVTQEIEEE